MILLTTADHKFFRALYQFLLSAERHAAEYQVVIFDLGMKPEQTQLLKNRFPRFELRPFPFDKYPRHVGEVVSFGTRKIKGYYAWKPIILADMMEECEEPIFWMDAATLIHGSLEPVKRQIEAHGNWVPISGGTLGQWTHAGTLRYLRVPLEILDRRNRHAGLCAFHPGFPRVRQLLADWKSMALQEECIAPPGCHLGNHRFDQSILTILLELSGLVLTDDENNIDSSNPVRFVSVHNKVPPRLPLCLDQIFRLYRRLYRWVDRSLWGLKALKQNRLDGLLRIAQERYSLAGQVRADSKAPLAKPQSWRTSCDSPFFIQQEEQAHVFFQEFDYLLNKSHISHATFDGRNGWSDTKRVLEERFSLSYPFLLEFDGKIYMIPDSPENRTIDLYECVSFPNRWKLAKRLMYGVRATHTSALFREGQWWLVTSLQEGSNSHLAIFSAAELLTVDWKPHPINQKHLYGDLPNSTGRGAGPFFELDGRLIRPVQKSPRYSGESLQFMEIEKFDRQEFEESPGEIRSLLDYSCYHHIHFDDVLLFTARRHRVPFGKTSRSSS